MGGGGFKDTDLGLEKIRREIAAMSELSVKVGILEGAGTNDGVEIAEYAAWNEFGVPGKSGWDIPPRPFIRGYVDSNAEKIKSVQKMQVAAIIDGKIDAKAAIEKIGKNAKEGIKHFIKTSSNFLPNAESTAKRKGRNRPLIDTGLMRDSVDYEVVKKAK